jgi:hypothetical protein
MLIVDQPGVFADAVRRRLGQHAVHDAYRHLERGGPGTGGNFIAGSWTPVREEGLIGARVISDRLSEGSAPMRQNGKLNR